jgi:hypothetical protein
MSPAAQYLITGGFERIGPVKGVKGFEVWHLRTAGAPDIAVAIPDAETASIDWATRGIFAAGEQSGAAAIRGYWLVMMKAMQVPTGSIGLANLPDAPALNPLNSEDVDHG